MAVDKLVDSTQLDSDLTSVANAIRAKSGGSSQLAFPNGFTTAIAAIPTGSTPTGTKQISITQNGTTTEDVTNYASAEIAVNVSGGGSSDYSLKYSREVTAKTTSTSSTTIATLETGTDIITKDKILYVKIRDKAGIRNGYFWGSDTFYANPSESQLSAGMIKWVYSFYNNKFSLSSSNYGVYASTVYTDGRVAIKTCYSSSISRTIDGTYSVEFYLLNWPNNTSPFV